MWFSLIHTTSPCYGLVEYENLHCFVGFLFWWNALLEIVSSAFKVLSQNKKQSHNFCFSEERIRKWKKKYSRPKPWGRRKRGNKQETWQQIVIRTHGCVIHTFYHQDLESFWSKWKLATCFSERSTYIVLNKEGQNVLKFYSRDKNRVVM